MFLFFGCSYKDIQQTQKHIHLKNFLETLSLFSQREFSEKERVLPNWIDHCDATGKVNII